MAQFGYVKIKLTEQLERTGLSKNKLSQRSETQRSQINRYCNNTISRLDVEVLARLCTSLDCKIEDLLEFVPQRDDDDRII